jgi:hypothetical protein
VFGGGYWMIPGFFSGLAYPPPKPLALQWWNKCVVSVTRVSGETQLFDGIECANGCSPVFGLPLEELLPRRHKETERKV